MKSLTLEQDLIMQSIYHVCSGATSLGAKFFRLVKLAEYANYYFTGGAAVVEIATIVQTASVDEEGLAKSSILAYEETMKFLTTLKETLEEFEKFLSIPI